MPFSYDAEIESIKAQLAEAQAREKRVVAELIRFNGTLHERLRRLYTRAWETFVTSGPTPMHRYETDGMEPWDAGKVEELCAGLIDDAGKAIAAKDEALKKCREALDMMLRVYAEDKPDTDGYYPEPLHRDEVEILRTALKETEGI